MSGNRSIRWNFRFLLLIIGAIYLAFPSHNSTIDAWGYAGCVRYGENLFLPHHLLYNLPFYLVYRLLQILGWEVNVLAMMKIGNAILGIGSLYGLGKILEKWELSPQNLVYWLAIAGCCFGFWRFTTENETYIFPIPFSLLGTWYFGNYLQANKDSDLVKSSFWAAFACLFHQIHVAWWLGLGMGVAYNTWVKQEKWIKNMLYFILPTFVVPLGYVLVLLFYEKISPTPNNLLHYILHDFKNGEAKTEWTLRIVAVMGINVLRSFVQIHGNIAYMLQRNWLWGLPAFFCMFWVGKFLFQAKIRLWIKEVLAETREIRLRTPSQAMIFLITHIIIGVGQLSLALFSRGNAEFLAMLPMIVVLVVAIATHPKTQPSIFLKYTTMILFVWNFCYGILPFYLYDFQNYDFIKSKIRTEPDAGFLLRMKPLIENQLYVETGQSAYPLLFNLPSVWEEKSMDTALLRHKTDSLLNSGRKVYTDAPQPLPILNRQFLLQKENLNTQFFASYQLIPLPSKNLWEVRSK